MAKIPTPAMLHVLVACAEKLHKSDRPMPNAKRSSLTALLLPNDSMWAPVMKGEEPHPGHLGSR